MWQNRLPSRIQTFSTPTLFKYYSKKQKTDIIILLQGPTNSLEFLNLKYLKKKQLLKHENFKWKILKDFDFPECIWSLKKVLELNG